MAITATLVDATPYRLRYRCVQDGVISSPPSLADAQTTIDALGAATPDLVTDIATVGTLGGASGAALRALVRSGQDGYGPLAAGAKTQAQARAILNSDDPGNAILNGLPAGILDVNGRTGAIAWAIDANIDGGSSFPNMVVTSETGTAADAYADLEYRDSYDF
jgi:hypothetical protein